MRFESTSRSWLLAVTLAASASLVVAAVAWPKAGGRAPHESKWWEGESEDEARRTRLTPYDAASDDESRNDWVLGDHFGRFVSLEP